MIYIRSAVRPTCARLTDNKSFPFGRRSFPSSEADKSVGNCPLTSESIILVSRSTVGRSAVRSTYVGPVESVPEGTAMYIAAADPGFAKGMGDHGEPVTKVWGGAPSGV